MQTRALNLPAESISKRRFTQFNTVKIMAHLHDVTRRYATDKEPLHNGLVDMSKPEIVENQIEMFDDEPVVEAKGILDFVREHSQELKQEVVVNPNVMLSTEIAALTGKEHKHVKRDIQEQILKGLYEIDDPKMDDIEIKGISVVIDNRGYVSEYHLDKEHTLTLITGYDVKKRHAINKRWLELEEEQQVKRPKNTGFLPPIAKEFRGTLSIAKMLGLTGNQAILHADEATNKVIGQSPVALLGIDLSSPKQERHFTPTELAKMTGLKSAIAVNKELEAKGYQEKVKTSNDEWYWKPTAKGQPFAVLLDKNKAHAHGTVQQLEWYESIKRELQ